MIRWVAMKLLAILALTWAVLTVSFLLLELSPGDPSDMFHGSEGSEVLRQETRALWRLDEPLPVRYLAASRNLLRGDLGTSMATGRPVREMVSDALPYTLQLSGLSLLLAFGIGVPAGTWQAARRGTPGDATVSVLSILTCSMPSFWLGLMLMLLFSPGLGLLPASGVQSWDHASLGFWGGSADRLRHIILPVATLALPSAAQVAWYTRANVRHMLEQPWILAARARGIPPGRLVARHALPNALPPLLVLLGLALPALFSGAVLVETVFGWPGMGRLTATAMLGRDTPVILACFFIITMLVLLGNRLADLAQALLDPRLRGRP